VDATCAVRLTRYYRAFTRRPDGGDTVLSLDHRLIDARVGMRAMSRWETHLARLDEILDDAGTR
jgi:hypothetical protein